MKNYFFKANNPGRMRGNIALILIVAVAAMALTAGIVTLMRSGGNSAANEAFLAASIYPETRALQPFELHYADDAPFTEQALSGQLSLLFFGFTNCPDICPDTLVVLSQAMDKLKSMRVDQPPQVVFVSVDPDRDGGDAMQSYVENFDPSFVAVTGDDDALQELTNQLGVLYARNAPDAQGFYSVDHSGMVVIVDSQARVLGRFRQGTNADELAADLFKLVREGV